MAAILDVWVMQPGRPCYVDDNEWIIRVFDESGVVYKWNGASYGVLPAPKANWSGTIPPGCYVVRGFLKANPNIVTDHAIVSLGCSGYRCVRLYVPKPGRGGGGNGGNGGKGGTGTTGQAGSSNPSVRRRKSR